MTVYLLRSVKEDVLKEGFSSKDEEIHFFKLVKPNILGKLIYYNKDKKKIQAVTGVDEYSDEVWDFIGNVITKNYP